MKTFKHIIIGLTLVGMLAGNAAAMTAQQLRELANALNNDKKKQLSRDEKEFCLGNDDLKVFLGATSGYVIAANRTKFIAALNNAANKSEDPSEPGQLSSDLSEAIQRQLAMLKELRDLSAEEQKDLEKNDTEVLHALLNTMLIKELGAGIMSILAELNNNPEANLGGMTLSELLDETLNSIEVCNQSELIKFDTEVQSLYKLKNYLQEKLDHIVQSGPETNLEGLQVSSNRINPSGVSGSVTAGAATKSTSQLVKRGRGRTTNKERSAAKRPKHDNNASDEEKLSLLEKTKRLTWRLVGSIKSTLGLDDETSSDDVQSHDE